MELEIKVNKVTFKIDIICIIRMFLIAFVCIVAIKEYPIAGIVGTGLCTFFYIVCKE